MDDIAAEARVSKQTIYTHFASKEELFSDLVLANAERVEGFISQIRPTLSGSRNVETGLRSLARLYLEFVMRPEVLRLRRLIIGEAGRFPDLARRYYELVPRRVYEALASEFRHIGLRDPNTAAIHFAWLTLGFPLDQAMFLPAQAAAKGGNVDRTAASAVRVLLAAYR